MGNSVEKMLSAKMFLVILWLLKKREMYGYEIIKAPRENSLESRLASCVYPVLNYMARLKVVE